MAPEGRVSPRHRVAPHDARYGAVLILLIEGSVPERRLELPLIVRADDGTTHGGQIGLPGGGFEPGDSFPVATALREAEEEIALPPTSVQVPGALTPLYIPPSNFCVHPFVGRATSVPDLHPTDEEVGQVLQVPLALLLDPATQQTEMRRLDDTDIEVPYYAVAGHTVWGATAMMIAELLAVFRGETSTD